MARVILKYRGYLASAMGGCKITPGVSIFSSLDSGKLSLCGGKMASGDTELLSNSRGEKAARN